jgi:hypothetical protein
MSASIIVFGAAGSSALTQPGGGPVSALSLPLSAEAVGSVVLADVSALVDIVEVKVALPSAEVSSSPALSSSLSFAPHAVDTAGMARQRVKRVSRCMGELLGTRERR